MLPVEWITTYYGQSPGDLENKKNGFAGRFIGYHPSLKHPIDYMITHLPIILIIGDSIIGDTCISYIRYKLDTIAEVSFLQQPHHCKNIMSWLDTWQVENWKYYSMIFFFDGMHGFPQRVTEKEYQKLTPFVINRFKTATKNILWCNCTPINNNFPQENSNSSHGPNTIEQLVTEETVINRNKSIQKLAIKKNIQLLDLYSLMKPIQPYIQAIDDIHFSPKGQILMGNHILKEIKNMLQTLE